MNSLYYYQNCKQKSLELFFALQNQSTCTAEVVLLRQKSDTFTITCNCSPDVQYIQKEHFSNEIHKKLRDLKREAQSYFCSSKTEVTNRNFKNKQQCNMLEILAGRELVKQKKMIFARKSLTYWYDRVIYYVPEYTSYRHNMRRKPTGRVLTMKEP